MREEKDLKVPKVSEVSAEKSQEERADARVRYDLLKDAQRERDQEDDQGLPGDPDPTFGRFFNCSSR